MRTLFFDMKLSDFNYDIPDELVAQTPLENRDEARLLVVHRKNQTIEHKQFKDILNYFDEGDVIVLNDSKVFPARLYGKKERTGAKIEVFLLRELNRESKLWDVVVDPARKIRVGNKLYFGNKNELVAEVVDNTTAKGRTIRFLFEGDYSQFEQLIDSLGVMPIPNYIIRKPSDLDRKYYQTLFAKNKGSVAAPSAGFYFTREILVRLDIKGVEKHFITLHTGYASFRDVEVEDLSKHKMDSEYYDIPETVAEAVNKAKLNKNKVCAVGATVMRALESNVSASRLLKPGKGWSDKFIFPPYDFSIANCLVTQFHPPKSTMLMMVSAFMDYEFCMHVYNEAIKEKYRFFVYGDAMLIL